MSAIRAWIALPSEGLGLFRQGLGLLCLGDALERLIHASFFLSDAGVLPRSLYFAFYETTQLWSLLQISGRPSFVVAILLLTAVLGAIQAFGRSTLRSRIALFILLMSIQNRNPALLDSSDDLLRLMLFWDMFLPGEQKKPSYDLVSPGTLGLQLQLTIAWATMASGFLLGDRGLRAQWSGRDWVIPHFATWEASLLLLLVLALWCRPLRGPVLCLAVPLLLLRLLFLHPVFPLTMAVATACLFKGRSRESDIQSTGRPWALALSGLVTVLVLGLNFVEKPSLRVHFVPMGQALGLLQNWKQVYPLAAGEMVELTAWTPGATVPVWRLDSQESRRMRLFSQRLGQNALWGSRIPSFLAGQNESSSSIMLWMRKERLRDDFLLGEVEIQLLSLTPVSRLTYGREKK